MNIIIHLEDDSVEVAKFASAHLKDVVNRPPNGDDHIIHVQYKDPENPASIRDESKVAKIVYEWLGKYHSYSKCCLICDLNPTTSDGGQDSSYGLNVISEIALLAGIMVRDELSYGNRLYCIRSKWLQDLPEAFARDSGWTGANAWAIRNSIRNVGGADDLGKRRSEEAERSVKRIVSSGPRFLVADRSIDNHWLVDVLKLWLK